MIPVSSWGRLSREPHNVISFLDPSQVQESLIAGKSTGIAFGMGRSYGDVCLNPQGTVWNTSGLNRFVSFDDSTGRLVCECGVLLRDIQRLAIPRGWILPVTPGTQLITVGGAVANDVHGKNHHHSGSFGNHVKRLRLVRTDGQVIDCGPGLNQDWFAATVGGFGMTGVITEVEIQLGQCDGPLLATETIPYNTLNEFLALSDESEGTWEHAVSWIDCLAKKGRGLFMRGIATHSDSKEHLASPSGKVLTMPNAIPVSLVNRLSLRPFNTAYFNLKKRQTGTSLTHYEPFFYPLDNINEWNRMYGPKGFFQYQSVVPRDAIQPMLDEIAKAGEGSFLAVLKTFGKNESVGLMSFPQPGATLALDFPNKGQKTLKLFDRLDAIVRSAKGRLYLAKDARMPRDLFESGYPNLNEFLKYRDPGISSSLSRRLIGS